MVIAHNRGVAVGGDINAPVFTGDILGDVRIEIKAPDIPPPPEPARPPEIASFIGRQRELEYFTHKLRDHHLAVITGLAGMGKTALAAALARNCTLQEKIFWHAFHERESIDVILWELAGFLAWHGQDELWRMLQSVRQVGGKLPPVETLFDYLINLLRGEDYLLCLDDLQHVDEDPLLNQLVSRIRGLVLTGELSIIITSRRMPVFVQVVEFEPLEGLSPEDLRDWMAVRGVPASSDELIEIHRLTGGNAQLANLAIHALLQAPDRSRSLSAMAESEDYELYLLNEVDTYLSHAEREVMEAVAILLGYPGSLDAIEAVLQSSNLRRILLELASRYLLITTRSEGRKEYSLHSILQNFYYELLGKRQRTSLHLNAAEYYVSEEPDPWKACLHYSYAGEAGQALRLIDAHIWEFINQGQLRSLSAILARFDPEKLEPQEGVQVCLAGGQVYSLFGKKDQARRCYEHGLVLVEKVDNTYLKEEMTGRACLGLAETLEQTNMTAAIAWLERGLVALAGDHQQEQAALWIKSGFLQMNLGENDAARDAYQRGFALLQADNRELQCWGLKNYAVLQYQQGEIEAAIATTQSALVISQKLNHHFHTVDLLSNLGIFRFTYGEWQPAVGDFQAALALAERLGSEALKAFLHGNLGTALLNLGELGSAREHLQIGLRLAQENHLERDAMTILYRLAELNLRQGETSAARQALDESEALARELGASWQLSSIDALWSEIHLDAGDTDLALARAKHGLESAIELGLDVEEGICLRAIAQAQVAHGERESALESFERSVAVLSSIDPYEAARSQAAWAMAAGEAAESARLLETACEVFQKLGAAFDLAALANRRNVN